MKINYCNKTVAASSLFSNRVKTLFVCVKYLLSSSFSMTLTLALFRLTVIIGFMFQYATEIQNNGGFNVGRYDASCTHVIVHGLTYVSPV